MRALGERGDIVKAINRALTDRGLERGMGQYVLHGEDERQLVIGRVIGKRLTDELGDRVALIVDGVDGRTHHVALGDKAVAQEVPIGSIVEVGRAPAGRARRIATSPRWPKGRASIARASTGRSPRPVTSACRAATTRLRREPCPAPGGAPPGWRGRATGRRPLVNPLRFRDSRRIV